MWIELSLQFLVFLATFCSFEFVAWFSHKYVMHGFLWVLHKDHHKKDHNSWFERNDLFFLIYASMSIVSTIAWAEYDFRFGLAIGLGIFGFGLLYFLVHDVFIHQRFKWFRAANTRYAKAIRRAHKMHHKHIGKEDGECFGLLLFPMKYYREAKN